MQEAVGDVIPTRTDQRKAMTSTRREPVVDPEVMLTEATLKAAALLGLTNAQLAGVIGVSGSTISRYKKDKARISPTSKTGELALLLVRVFRSLSPLVGSDGELHRVWMHSDNKALGGVPIELIVESDGLVRTLSYLEGMNAAA